MIQGAPAAAGWHRAEPRHAQHAILIPGIVAAVFPSRSLAVAKPLSGGMRNANFHLRFHECSDTFVLRIYEHDPSLCAKEVDLLCHIGGSVPTPDLVHAVPCGLPGTPPFAIFRFVEGVTLHQIKRSADAATTHKAAYAVGQSLAAIGRIRFPQSGWLGPGPRVTAPLLEGPNPAPRFTDLCLASPILEQRMPPALRDQIHTLIWQMAPQLAALDLESSLVHGDYGKRNILLAQAEGKCAVAAVLDWEFAIAASPLHDIGHLLRYERTGWPLLEPHFSRGFIVAGGLLPPQWRRLSRVLDMITLCENLTHDDLPDPIAAELLELVAATAGDRDAQLP